MDRLVIQSYYFAGETEENETPQYMRSLARIWSRSASSTWSWCSGTGK